MTHNQIVYLVIGLYLLVGFLFWLRTLDFNWRLFLARFGRTPFTFSGAAILGLLICMVFWPVLSWSFYKSR